MRWIGFLTACAMVVLVATNPLRADDASEIPPRPRVQKPAAPTGMKSEVLVKAANVSMAHLVIPAKVLARLAEKAPRASAAPTGPRTVVAGIALSAALVVGGLQLVRRKNTGARQTALLLTLSGAIVFVAASAVWADIAPGPGPRRPVLPPEQPVQQPDSAPPGLTLPVYIDLGGEGDQVTLTLSAPDAVKIQSFVSSHTNTHAGEPKDDPGAVQTPPEKK